MTRSVLAVVSPLVSQPEPGLLAPLALPPDVVVPTLATDAPPPGAVLGQHYTRCYGCGADQSGGLRMKFIVGEGVRVTSEFVVTEDHEGAPGLAHGGLLSAALDETPVLPTRAGPAPTPLPPEGAFEGVEGARLRAEIAESEQRLAMLEQVLVEVDQLQARRARAQATSALLESLGGELK